jgi:hypothetical protein
LQHQNNELKLQYKNRQSTLSRNGSQTKRYRKPKAEKSNDKEVMRRVSRKKWDQPDSPILQSLPNGKADCVSACNVEKDQQ